jgi:hypothetical protein
MFPRIDMIERTTSGTIGRSTFQLRGAEPDIRIRTRMSEPLATGS